MKSVYKKLFCLMSVFIMTFLMAACGKAGENADVSHNNISADSEANGKSISGYERKGILQQEISAMRLQLQDIFYRQVIVKMYHHIQVQPLCRRLIRGRILSI